MTSSESLDLHALSYHEIIFIHWKNMYSFLYRVSDLKILTPKLIYPLLHGNTKKETETENAFTMTSGGFMTAVRNISFIDSK